ncbi:MAG: arginine repressor [Bacillota bacterium]
MKTRRQMRILGIINERPIKTQQELVEALRDDGMDVTQATVSRDIKELGLVKVPAEDGGYQYRESSQFSRSEINRQLVRTLETSVVGMDSSGTILVVNTLPATAQTVAEAIDALNWNDVIGTLAGERIVFVVVKPAERISDVMARIREFSDQNR